MDRKDFFKTIANKVGDKLVRKIDAVQQIVEEEPDLSEDQKQFLKTYTDWLSEFQIFVNKRNSNPFDIENNKRLMNLSADAEKRKIQLEDYMNDAIFSNHFNRITLEITELIN